MGDLISRQDAIQVVREYMTENQITDGDWHADGIERELHELPSTESEHLTDNEQRIFLAAMGREEKVCKEVDEECRNCREPYEDSLVRTCHEITRKVKGALWT